jgi:hypothetical protein
VLSLQFIKKNTRKNRLECKKKYFNKHFPISLRKYECTYDNWIWAKIIRELNWNCALLRIRKLTSGLLNLAHGNLYVIKWCNFNSRIRFSGINKLTRKGPRTMVMNKAWGSCFLCRRYQKFYSRTLCLIRRYEYVSDVRIRTFFGPFWVMFTVRDAS